MGARQFYRKVVTTTTNGSPVPGTGKPSAIKPKTH